jgi:hypothetical protein
VCYKTAETLTAVSTYQYQIPIIEKKNHNINFAQYGPNAAGWITALNSPCN